MHGILNILSGSSDNFKKLFKKKLKNMQDATFDGKSITKIIFENSPQYEEIKHTAILMDKLETISNLQSYLLEINFFDIDEINNLDFAYEYVKSRMLELSYDEEYINDLNSANRYSFDEFCNLLYSIFGFSLK